MNKITQALTSELVRFESFLHQGRNHGSRIVAGVFALMLCLMPMSAMAQTTFGDSAKDEVAKITPQVTTVGLAIIGVIGVIIAVYVVMRMMKKV